MQCIIYCITSHDYYYRWKQKRALFFSYWSPELKNPLHCASSNYKCYTILSAIPSSAALIIVCNFCIISRCHRNRRNRENKTLAAVSVSIIFVYYSLSLNSFFPTDNFTLVFRFQMYSRADHLYKFELHNIYIYTHNV